jgi:hypothetical protein
MNLLTAVEGKLFFWVWHFAAVHVFTLRLGETCGLRLLWSALNIEEECFYETLVFTCTVHGLIIWKTAVFKVKSVLKIETVRSSDILLPVCRLYDSIFQEIVMLLSQHLCSLNRIWGSFSCECVSFTGVGQWTACFISKFYAWRTNGHVV